MQRFVGIRVSKSKVLGHKDINRGLGGLLKNTLKGLLLFSRELQPEDSKLGTTRESKLRVTSVLGFVFMLALIL